ncbi:hypothetical protein ACA910_003163 [Epithemia clementina (nom. ined.)]
MPSRIFQELAQSQLELLANSLNSSQRPGSSKIKTTALYLPQENVITGQLEFTPAILYPMKDRVFIASDADSGVAPTLPPTLTKLPGFSHAKALMPAYPMVSSSEGRNADFDGGVSVGVVEEVLCDVHRVGSCALSVPLFMGLQTIGVLLVSPADLPENPEESVWTEQDRQQVSRAARSLALALSMDQENKAMVDQNEQIAQALSDSMHQLKNPLQALRTYSKLLQRQIASDEEYDTSFRSYRNGGSSQRRLIQLADHLMVQSDRLVQRLSPVDSMVEKLASSSAERHLFLLPATTEKTTSLPAKKSLALSPSSAEWRTPLLPRKQEKGALIVKDDTLPGSLSTFSSTTVDSRKKSSFKESSKLALRSLVPNGQNGVPDELKLEMAFVQDVLEPVFCAFSAISEERNIDFEVQYGNEELPGVYIHPESLQEVMSNILDNAFKYVVLKDTDSQNQSPKVRVFLFSNEDEDKASGVTILVTDNGPGIPREHAIGGLVFGRGYRVPSTKDRAQGQGLGLSIAHKLMQAMGGELRVVFSENKKRAGFHLLEGATLALILWRRRLLLK